MGHASITREHTRVRNLSLTLAARWLGQRGGAGNGRLVVGSGGGRCLGNLCLGNHSRVGESNNGKAYVLAIILERESQTMLRPMSWQSFLAESQAMLRPMSWGSV